MKTNKILKILIAIVLLASLQTSVIAATKGTVNVDTVRVREEATTKSGIVALVSIGDKIDIIGEEAGEGGTWYKVKVDGEVGYIRNDLLTVEGKVTTETPNNADNNNEPEEPEAPADGNVNEEPSDNEETPEQTTTEQPSENNDENVQKNDKEISTIKISGQADVGKMINLTEKTKIKILPSVNSSNIAELQAGTDVIVVEVINSWCRIETGDNVGWVRIDQ